MGRAGVADRAAKASARRLRPVPGMAVSHPRPEGLPQRLPSFARMCIVPPPGSRSGTLERVSWLTPYAAETIGDDAMRAGRGARLEVTLSPNTPDEGLAAVESLFAWLGEKGVEVAVRRSEEV
jgi:hypothetical protein